MAGWGAVASASALFVGTHFGLSHPLRRSLVGAIGEGGFLGLYSIVAFATLGGIGWAWRLAPATAPLWPVGDGLWAVTSAVMLVASILLMGSVIRNPALPAPGAAARIPHEARGVFAVTRHPMLWSVALWGICHILVNPVAKNIAVASAIIILSLVGAALQDRKKGRLDPGGWPLWQQRTSYLPFAAIVTRRARLNSPGVHALAGGTLIWLAATWLHIPLAGWRAGIWRWIG